jgi:hypothetical protein
MKTRSRDLSADFAVSLGGLLPIVTAMVLVPLRTRMLNANVALVLMATVVLAALFGDRWAGVVAAVSATLSFDFFHTQPYGSITIASADDVETAVVLLAVGIFVGTLTTRRRLGQLGLRRRVAEGAEEIERLRRVADLVARGGQPAEVLFECERELTGLLRLESCEFHAGPSTGELPVLQRTGWLEGASLRFVDGEFALPESGAELPVLHRGQRVGAFVLRADPDVGVSMEQRVVAVAIADQAGAVFGSR